MSCLIVTLLSLVWLSFAAVSVFEAGEGGFVCVKIPVLLATKNGTLLAFGEARGGTCQDWDPTVLVYKRSMDGGNTWGPMLSLLALNYNGTLGNAAPVQLRSGRILLPFCLNNINILLTYSDDDGKSWLQTPLNITNTTVPKGSLWVGTGPPGSLQLASGRVVIPSYAAFVETPLKDGELTHSYMILSDDQGITWRIGGFLNDDLLKGQFSNECQAVEPYLNNSVLVAARGLGPHRLQGWSHDGGETFEPTTVVSLKEPIEGCEMSVTHLTSTNQDPGVLLLTGPLEFSLYRTNFSLATSSDAGRTWSLHHQIFAGPSAYSSLQVLPSRKVGCLYEISNQSLIDFRPTQTLFEIVF